MSDSIQLRFSVGAVKGDSFYLQDGRNINTLIAAMNYLLPVISSAAYVSPTSTISSILDHVSLERAELEWTVRYGHQDN